MFWIWTIVERNGKWNSLFKHLSFIWFGRNLRHEWDRHIGFIEAPGNLYLRSGLQVVTSSPCNHCGIICQRSQHLHNLPCTSKRKQSIETKTGRQTNPNNIRQCGQMSFSSEMTGPWNLSLVQKMTTEDLFGIFLTEETNLTEVFGVTPLFSHSPHSSSSTNFHHRNNFAN